MSDQYSLEATARIYDLRDGIIEEQSGVISELVQMQTRSLVDSRSLQQMVEERDQTIKNLRLVVSELRGRIALMSMPSGTGGVW